jgi:hypothetical protein
VIDVAFEVDHESVDDWPLLMLAGFAFSMAVGIGVGAVTVTVAVALLEPAELVAMSVYVVVEDGETLCDPLLATAVPFNVTVVAFTVFHESIDDCPLWMLAGFAFIEAVGIGVVADTVTLAVAVVEPAELVAISVYVVVEVGETLCDPLVATEVPFNVTVVAFDVFHESIDDCPFWMLAGFAFIEAVGIGVVADTVTVAVSVVEPAELVATSVYVLVAVGDVLFDPLAETTAPSNVTWVAFDDVHVNIDDWPLWIEVGEAVRFAVGIPTGGGVVDDTVTVTSSSTWRSPLPASISYLLV